MDSPTREHASRIRRVTTDDRAWAWVYRYLGSPSMPFPWTTTVPSAVTFTTLALPTWTAAALIFQWQALILVVATIPPIVMLTRRLTAKVNRDKTLTYWRQVFRIELHGRRPEKAAHVETRLNPDVLEFHS